jgi:choline dehydrogenase-like flavoprotein
VYAKKEVLLCAGAFGSPQILELSGVGSASVLAFHNIKVIIDNDNVGENLQDHPLACYSVEAADGELTVESLRNPEFVGQAYKEYTEHRTGFLAAPLISSSALLQYKATLTENKELQEAAEVDKILAGGEPLRPGLAKQYQLTREGLLSDTETSIQLLLVHAGIPMQDPQSTRKIGQPTPTPNPGSYITITSCLLHPFSRGSVHIRSSDPTAHPTIDPRYLSHPLDIRIFAKHMLHASKITTAEPLASRLKDKGTALHPGYYTLTEENVEEFIRTQLNTQHHPLGTCSMMPRQDGGVVGERFKVYGTRNLRVVDASVIPLQTASNTTSTIYAIAERAADMVKQDWRLAVS